MRPETVKWRPLACSNPLSTMKSFIRKRKPHSSWVICLVACINSCTCWSECVRRAHTFDSSLQPVEPSPQPAPVDLSPSPPVVDAEATVLTPLAHGGKVELMGAN